jgi:hypothetical protein
MLKGPQDHSDYLQFDPYGIFKSNPKMTCLHLLKHRPIGVLLRSKAVLASTSIRSIQTYIEPSYEQWILDRQLLRPDRAETCQSGTDDEVGHHKSPYDGSNTAVDKEVSALRDEYKSEGDLHDPLLVSPANLDVSLILDPMIRGAFHSSPTLRSCKGWSNKHKMVLMRTEPYEMRKYEDVFFRFIFAHQKV